MTSQGHSDVRPAAGPFTPHPEPHPLADRQPTTCGGRRSAPARRQAHQGPHRRLPAPGSVLPGGEPFLIRPIEGAP